MLLCIDTETHLFRRGWMAPRGVCMTVSSPHSDAVELDDLIGRIADEVGDEHIVHSTLDPLGDRPFDGYLLDRRAMKFAWEVFLDCGAHLLFHNAAFDIRVLIQAVPSSAEAFVEANEAHRIWDTVHREKILANVSGKLSTRIDPFTGKPSKSGMFNLATLVMRYFDIDIRDEKTDPEAWRLRYFELDGIPVRKWPERAVNYALLDAVWPLLVAFRQEEHLPEWVGDASTRCPILADSPHPPGLSRFAGELHQSYVAMPLSSAAGWGLRTDPKAVAETLAEWEESVARGIEIGEEAGFVRVAGRDKGKPGSRDLAALRNLISEAYGGVPTALPLDDLKGLDKKAKRRIVKAYCEENELDPDLYSDAGQLRYAAEVLESSGDEVLEGYAQTSTATTWLTRYGPMLQEATRVPLTYGYDTMKATMRASLFDPPYHQPPRKGGFRECHRPRPGWVYIMADYDQAELRAIAQIHHWWGLGDELREMFVQGIDPHAIVAVDILNAEEHTSPTLGTGDWTYDLFREGLSGDLGTEWAKVTDDYRQLAKAANFGFRGGLGAATFVKFARSRGVTGLDTERAAFVKVVWKERFPCDVAYLDEISNRIGPTEPGEDRRFTQAFPFTGMVRGGCTYTSGANGNFQHLVAAIQAFSGWLVWREQYTNRGTALFGTRTVLFLHDELILEAPEHMADAAARRLEEVMTQGGKHHLPDVPVTVEAVLARKWSKNARRLKKNGVLVPWNG